MFNYNNVYMFLNSRNTTKSKVAKLVHEDVSTLKQRLSPSTLTSAHSRHFCQGHNCTVQFSSMKHAQMTVYNHCYAVSGITLVLKEKFKDIGEFSRASLGGYFFFSPHWRCRPCVNVHAASQMAPTVLQILADAYVWVPSRFYVSICDNTRMYTVMHA